MAHDVFISYASPDAAIATAVCDSLETDGIACWIAPRDVEAGAEYAEAIVTAIRSSRVFVLVFSAAANDSVHVRRELDRAVSAGLAVLPLRIEDLEPAGALDYYLAGRQWCDAFDAPLEPHLERLRAAVKDLLAEKKHTPQVHGAARKRTPLVLAGAAVLVLAVVAALVVWALMPSRTPPPAAADRSSGTHLTSAQIYDKYDSGIVRITSVFPSTRGGSGPPLKVSGTGFVVSNDGIVLTSSALVNHGALTTVGSRVSVRIEDWADAQASGASGSFVRVAGAVLTFDNDSGVAVIQVNPRSAKLVPIPRGNSESVRVGDAVLRMSHADPLNITLTSGVVSATPRGKASGQSAAPMTIGRIETDMPIRSGDVGAPLFDLSGHVIGVQGPSSSVPINDAVAGIAALRKQEAARHAELGVVFQDVRPSVAKALGYPAVPGALVEHVSKGGPAAAAGVRGGDVQRTIKGVKYVTGGDLIVAVDGVPVRSGDQLGQIVMAHHPGDRIALKLFRGRKVVIVRATLAAPQSP